MKKLVTRYIRLHKEVAFLEKLAVFLLIALGAYSLYSIYSVGLDNSLNQIETFGVVLSVILVSKIASRQIIHSELVIEYDRANSLVASMHFLMTAIDDMLNKAHFIQTSLLNVSPANASVVDTLITFIHDIEAGYQVLKDKESHKHLNGSTLVLIWDMSIHIVILKKLAKMLAKPETINLPSLSSDTLLTILQENELGSPDFTKAVDNILVALQQIDKEVRELRISIDLPVNLREEYEKF